MTLINSKKEVVKIGDEYPDFRNENIWVVCGWAEPHKVGSTGRIYCYIKDTNRYDTEREFFPGVLNLSWK